MNYNDANLAEIMEVGMDNFTGEWGTKDTIAVPESCYVTVEDVSLMGNMPDVAQCVIEEFSGLSMEATTNEEYYFSLLIKGYEEGEIKDVCSSIVHLLLDNKVERFTITVHEQELYE